MYIKLLVMYLVSSEYFTQNFRIWLRISSALILVLLTSSSYLGIPTVLRNTCWHWFEFVPTTPIIWKIKLQIPGLIANISSPLLFLAIQSLTTEAIQSMNVVSTSYEFITESIFSLSGVNSSSDILVKVARISANIELFMLTKCVMKNLFSSMRRLSCISAAK